MKLIKIILLWLLGILAFCFLVAWAGNETENNCKEKGRRLNAPAELVGSHCLVKGWGRVF